jgi:hypothetical protein
MHLVRGAMGAKNSPPSESHPQPPLRIKKESMMDVPKKTTLRLVENKPRQSELNRDAEYARKLAVILAKGDPKDRDCIRGVIDQLYDSMAD